MDDMLALHGGPDDEGHAGEHDTDLARAAAYLGRHSTGNKRRRSDTVEPSTVDAASSGRAGRAPSHMRFDEDADAAAQDDEGTEADKAGRARPSRQDTTASRSDSARAERPSLRFDERKFERGDRVATKRIDDLKLKRQMREEEARFSRARKAAAHAELLLTEEAGYLEADGPLERTYKFSQAEVAAAADVGVSRKAAEITLDTYGPYTCAYLRNGRHMLLGGEKGHIAVVDWNFFRVSTEFHVGQTVHDVCFLHNQTLFAVAQKKYAYIYDNTGAEVHILRNHVNPLMLDFLPYHFLLVSAGNAGYLKYQDVSTGDLVAEHRTRAGAPRAMRQNPWNAVMHVGHGDGTVTLWTPNMSNAVVKMICHSGPVTSLAVDPTGRYMVTAGSDARMKVWDIRAFRDDPVYNYFVPAPATSLDISQRGLLAVAYGGHVNVWGRDVALELSKTPLSAPVSLVPGSRVPDLPAVESDRSRPKTDHTLPKGVHKAAAPYMRHNLPGKTVRCVRFRPYDDICAVGHSLGLSTMIVPGAGEPNYDSREANPFESKKARLEAEVHNLLDKIPPTMISLDPNTVARVDRAAPAVRAAEARARADSAAAKKSRGRSRSERQRLKRNANVVTAQRAALREKIQAEERERVAAAAAAAEEDAGKPSSALDRFYVKRK